MWHCSHLLLTAMVGLLLQHPAAAAIDQHRLPTGLTQRLAAVNRWDRWMDGQTAGHCTVTQTLQQPCAYYMSSANKLQHLMFI